MTDPRPTSPAPGVPAAPAKGSEIWIPAALGALALTPLIVFRHEFSQLFWFGDEFDQIDIIDKTGLWHWVFAFFAENFIPVFKLLWAAAVFGFHGSYLATTVALWLTHACNSAMLGRVMRAVGISWLAVACAQLVFGLTPITIEILGWPIQWSGALCTLFFLLGLDRCLRAEPSRQPLSWRIHGTLFAFSAASAWCFARGVVTGPILALACLLPGTANATASRRGRVLAAAACLIPALITAALIKAFAGGNHQHMHGHFGEAAVFSLWYYCMNPGWRLLWFESWGWHTVVVLGLLKFGLIAWTLARSRGTQRLLFVLLVGFDLINAFLLGIGRFNTGLETAVSSRYQYPSLVGILPLAAFWLAFQVERVPRGRLRKGVSAAVAIAVGILASLGWTDAIVPFAFWRGTHVRDTLLHDPHAKEYDVAGIPFMTTERARELIRKYNLH